MQQAWIAFLCSRPQQKPNSAMSYANSEPIPLHLIATHFTKLHKILAITSAPAKKKKVHLHLSNTLSMIFPNIFYEISAQTKQKNKVK